MKAPLRHAEDCARIVSNLTMRCNCGARRYQRSVEAATNDVKLAQHYIENNDAPAVTWLRARFDSIVFYLDSAEGRKASKDNPSG